MQGMKAAQYHADFRLCNTVYSFGAFPCIYCIRGFVEEQNSLPCLYVITDVYHYMCPTFLGTEKSK